jgi:propionyl-CoA carboxylase alpha chain
VEFIVDGERNFYFLEMNTRLQVEHPVTELITGIDLVEQMIRVAYGEKLSFGQADVTLNGWAMESRLYAEDPYRGFLPSIGRLSRYRPPEEVVEPARAVRNDTGVYEGGEISMFYDPMIAKLCSWGPDRAAAIEEMRVALDGFELEGIGHNLPFLSAVMDHPRFVSGDITTAFIEEEYPDGFDGVALNDATMRRLAAIVAHMKMVREERGAKISGAMRNHKRRIDPHWVAFLGKSSFAMEVEERAALEVDGEIGVTAVRFEDGVEMEVRTGWKPGQPLCRAEVDGAPMIVKIDSVTGGGRMRYRGAELRVIVRTPREAELFALMPEKAPPDTSKLLLCPMPGLVVSIAVAEGDEVQEGQALCTVEAMKMENVLRAERKGVVARINAEAGASLMVDDVIMEFG